MPKFIVPLYGAEKISCHLCRDPVVRIEPWNRQIKDLRMFPDQEEDIPDCVAIVEGEGITGDPLDILYRYGLLVLPLIFERPFHIYQMGDEESIKTVMSAPYIVDKKGYAWIRPGKLNEFLETAVRSLNKYGLHFALSFHQEIAFRTSAANVQFIMEALLLEHLSNVFISRDIESPLSTDTITEILGVVKRDLTRNGHLTPSDSPKRFSKYNKIKSNLNAGLNEKSFRQMAFEFLHDKCGFDINENYVARVVELRGKMVHDPANCFKEGSEDFTMISDLEYINRVALIKVLSDFNPGFQKFIRPHTHFRVKILKWEDF
jgi:hypothetical protein